MVTHNNMTKKKAEQLVNILEAWISKGKNGKLKKYTMSEQFQTEEKIAELKKIYQ